MSSRKFSLAMMGRLLSSSSTTTTTSRRVSSCSTGSTCKNLCYSTSSADIQSRLEAAYTNAISARELEQLFNKGYAVIENAGFDPSVGREIRKEIDAIPNNRFTANSTRFVKDGTQTELVKQNIRELSPPFQETDGTFLNALQRDRTLLTLLNVHLPSETPSEMLFNASLKLQINDGENARFPIHFDSDSSTDQRRWTFLVYLNDEWEEKEKHGGELVLYLPFQEEKKVVVQPKMGTIVMFNSRYVAHSTLPFKGKCRVMYTVWLHCKGSLDGSAKRSTNNKKDSSSKSIETDAKAQLKKLLLPEQRKHLTKLVLAEEWAQSIAEAHDPKSESTARALKTHWEEVDIIARVLSQSFPFAFDRLAELMKTGKISEFPLKF